MPSSSSSSDGEKKQLVQEANLFPLLEEILIRLPVKSLFRFKCVDKTWLSETSSPSFISSYCRRRAHHHHHPPWALLYQLSLRGESGRDHTTLDRLYSSSLNHHGGTSPRQLSVVQHPYEDDDDVLKIIAESNGLLCCKKKPYYYGGGGQEGGRYCVCDPITNQWAFLPRNDTSARCLAKGKKSYELDHPRFFSFNNNNNNNKQQQQHHHHHHHPVDVEEEADDIEGFIALVENGVCTQYKLVVPAGYLYGSDRVHALDIFCYQTGVWTRVEIELPIPLHGHSLSKPFALGGKLHWPDYVEEEWVLLVYDPFRDDDDDEAQLVPLPDGRSSDHEVHSRMCGVSGGVVQYYEVAAHHHHTHIVVKVWELADSTSGWIVKHRVSWGGVWSKDDELLLLSSSEPSNFRFYPIAFHPFDSDVVYLHNRKYIICFNIGAQRLDVLCEHTPPRTCSSWSFCWKMLPVVLPVWPTFPPRSFWEKMSS